MKKALLLVGLLMMGFSLFALDTVDVVQTADGSVYKGVILENQINQFIRIEIAGGSVIKLAYGQITSITREKGQAATPSVAAATPAAPAVDDRKLVEAIQDRLYGLSVGELRDIDADALGVPQLSSQGRREVYRDLEKTDASGPFVLNLLLGLGIGSFVQGDNAAGWYGLLSGLGYVGGAVFMAYEFLNIPTYLSYPYSSSTGRAVSNYTTGALVFGALALNYSIAYIIGLVSPFTFQDNYNRALKETLQY